MSTFITLLSIIPNCTARCPSPAQYFSGFVELVGCLFTKMNTFSMTTLLNESSARGVHLHFNPFFHVNQLFGCLKIHKCTNKNKEYLVTWMIWQNLNDYCLIKKCFAHTNVSCLDASWKLIDPEGKNTIAIKFYKIYLILLIFFSWWVSKLSENIV